MHSRPARARAALAGSLFGAALDMLTDRASTLALLVCLATFYPRAGVFFQLSAMIDIVCHWIHMHRCDGRQLSVVEGLGWRCANRSQAARVSCLTSNGQQPCAVLLNTGYSFVSSLSTVLAVANGNDNGSAE